MNKIIPTKIKLIILGRNCILILKAKDTKVSDKILVEEDGHSQYRKCKTRKQDSIHCKNYNLDLDLATSRTASRISFNSGCLLLSLLLCQVMKALQYFVFFNKEM